MPLQSIPCQAISRDAHRGAFSSSEMHLEMVVLLRIPSAPKYWDVLPNLKCFPLKLPRIDASVPSVQVWIRAPALAAAAGGREGIQAL